MQKSNFRVRGDSRIVSIVIGIDCGTSGAMAMIADNGDWEVVTVPTTERRLSTRTKKGNPRYSTELDEDAIHQRVIDWRNEHGAIRHAFIEKAQVISRWVRGADGAMKRETQGAISNFKIGFGLGFWSGLFGGLDVPREIVPPQTWQKAMFQGMGADTKMASIIVCKRLYPGIDLRASERCRVDNSNMSDALLIATYGRRQLGVR